MTAMIKVRSQDLEWREVDGEVVLLDLRTSLYLAVNRTGGVLWPAVRKGATRTELVSLLVSSLAVDQGTAAKDVDGFVASLARHGLLEE